MRDKLWYLQPQLVQLALGYDYLLQQATIVTLTINNSLTIVPMKLKKIAPRLRCWRRPHSGNRKRANLLAGSLARVVPELVCSRPPCFLAKSTRVACFFSIVFFECVGFSYVVLDLVCLDYFAK